MGNRILETYPMSVSRGINYLEGCGWKFRGVGIYLWMDYVGGVRLKINVSTGDLYIYKSGVTKSVIRLNVDLGDIEDLRLITILGKKVYEQKQVKDKE